MPTEAMDPAISSQPSLCRYSNKAADNTQSEEDCAIASHGVPKDWKFWCIIFSLGLSVLLTAVEFVSYFLHRLTARVLGTWDFNAFRCIRRPQSELRFRRSYVTSMESNSSGLAPHMRSGRRLWCHFVVGSHRCRISLSRARKLRPGLLLS